MLEEMERRKIVHEAIEEDLTILGCVRRNELFKVVSKLDSNGGLSQYDGGGQGHTLLHWAALHNCVQIATLLIKFGNHVNAVNDFGESAVFWAISAGHLSMVNHLLGLGASLGVVSKSGLTVLHKAAQGDDESEKDPCKHVAMMDLLLRKGAGANATDGKGRTALHWAAYKNKPQACQWLLAHGVSPLQRDSERCLPVHWAALKGNSEVIRVLLGAGAREEQLKAVDVTQANPKQLAQAKMEAIPSTFSHLQRDRDRYKACLDVMRSPSSRERLFERLQDHAPDLTSLLLALALWLHFAYFRYTSPAEGWGNLTFKFLWLPLTYCWLRVRYADPGSVEPQDIMETGETAGAQYHAALTSSKPQEFALCGHCQVFQIRRSKHCHKCNMCVLRADQHSTLAGRCIGAETHRAHVLLLWCTLFVAMMGFGQAFHTMAVTTAVPNFVSALGLALYGLMFFVVAKPCVLACMMIYTNLLDYELKELHAVRYFIDNSNGEFLNPWDRGGPMNCISFFLGPKLFRGLRNAPAALPDTLRGIGHWLRKLGSGSGRGRTQYVQLPQQDANASALDKFM